MPPRKNLLFPLKCLILYALDKLFPLQSVARIRIQIRYIKQQENSIEHLTENFAAVWVQYGP